MRKKALKVMILLFLVFPAILVLPVDSINQQGLYWAFDVADEFHYTAVTSGSSTKITVRIDALRDIPEVVNETWEDAAIGSYQVTYLFDNGTISSVQSGFIAVAVGNWTLLSELMPTSPPVVETYNNPDYWGWKWYEETPRTIPETSISFTSRHTRIYKFSKADGAISYYMHQEDFDDRDGIIDLKYEFIREGYNPTATSIVMLSLIVGIAAVAVIIIVLWKYKR